jgi:uncharacterized membrane protein YeaQ/YmgE (transglycosylase-associated protein family)
MLNLIIQLICGALGGNIAGSLMKDKSLGRVGDSIVGILGGGLGGQLLGLLTGAGSAGAAGGSDLGSILASVLGGGAGGGILMWIVGLVRSAMHKTA